MCSPVYMCSPLPHPRWCNAVQSLSLQCMDILQTHACVIIIAAICLLGCQCTVLYIYTSASESASMLLNLYHDTGHDHDCMAVADVACSVQTHRPDITCTGRCMTEAVIHMMRQ